MSDLKYRLAQKDHGDVPLGALDAMSEAADRIEALEAENKALRKSLAKACAAYLDQLEKAMGREIKSGEMPGWWHAAQSLVEKGET